MKHSNLVSGLVGGVVAVAALTLFGGVQQPQPARGPHIVGVDVGGIGNGVGGQFAGHIAYRMWSTGRIQYAIVRGVNLSGQESSLDNWAGGADGELNLAPTVYDWRDLAVTPTSPAATVGLDNRADLPRVVGFKVEDLGQNRGHLLYRFWSDGQIDYASIRGTGMVNGFSLELDLPSWIGHFDQPPVVYDWRVLPTN